MLLWSYYTEVPRVSSEHNQENKFLHAFLIPAERLPRQRRRENKTKGTVVGLRPKPSLCCAIFLALPHLSYEIQQ